MLHLASQTSSSQGCHCENTSQFEHIFLRHHFSNQAQMFGWKSTPILKKEKRRKGNKLGGEGLNKGRLSLNPLLWFTIRFWRLMKKLMVVWGCMGPIRYWKAPISCIRSCLRLNAISSIWARSDALRPHGLKIVRWACHVLEIWERLQSFDDVTHQGTSFRISAKAVSCQLRSLLGTFYREVTFKPWIYQSVESSSLSKMWPSPFN